MLSWYEGSGRFEIEMPQDAADDMSVPGQDASEACDYWADKIVRHRDVTPEVLRECLREYGAWDDDDLADDDANWRRILWSAACDLREEANRNCKEEA